MVKFAFPAVLLLLAVPGFSTEAPYGVRPDCSERPLSYAELKAIADSPKTENIIDFLKQIPPETMQTFTLIYNSLSLQRGMDPKTRVRPWWPRVLRTNKDGTLTFTYTCDPQSETHDVVEVIRFEDGEFKTSEWKLRQRPGGRVHENPKACVRCHTNSNTDPLGSISKINGVVSLKPNWEEYFFWGDCDSSRGVSVYGSNDDNMSVKFFRPRYKEKADCDSELDKQTHAQEIRDYLRFRELQKDNPCYALLPWAKTKPGETPDIDLTLYPYAPESQANDQGKKLRQLATRTNLRITSNYSSLMGVRAAKLVQQSADFERAKYLLAMDALGCAIDDALIAPVAPYFPPQVRHSDQPDFSIRHRHLLESYAEHIGFKPADWTMNFREQREVDYNTGFAGSDGIVEITSRRITDAVLSELPGMKLPPEAYTTPISKYYGAEYSCMDEPIRTYFSEGLKDLKSSRCAALSKAHEAAILHAKARGKLPKRSVAGKRSKSPSPPHQKKK